MDNVQLYWVFIIAGTGLIAAAIGAGLTQGFATSRQERRHDKNIQSLIKGIGQEYRLNLFEALGEFQQLILGSHGGLLQPLEPNTPLRPNERLNLVPVEPRLQHAAMQQLAELDHSSMAVMSFGYRELERHKREIAAATEAGKLHYWQVQNAVQEVIKGLSLLYLWRHHYGRTPQQVHSIRKRELIDYATAQGLGRFNFPGLYLKDMFVESLRSFGLKVTPVPLVMTAAEYFARPPGDKGRVARQAVEKARKESRDRAKAALDAAEEPSEGGLLDRLKGLIPSRRKAEEPAASSGDSEEAA